MKFLKLAALTCSLILAGLLLGEAQIAIPYTFTTGTTISSSQVNANFSALGTNACNLTGCTLQGLLTTLGLVPVSDATSDLGTSGTKYRNLYLSGTTTLNTRTYTWPSSETANYFLRTNGSGTLSWANAPVDLQSCGLRLSLTTGTPITTADVTAATSVFVSPIKGGQCSFYDGAAFWTPLTNSQVTIAVPATTSTMYDVYCYNSSGAMACEALAWTNDTTRATALTTQNNVYVKTGDTTRRYIGSFRTTTVSGQTEDSATKRYVWSYYNRVQRMLSRAETANTWSYTTNTYRQANGSTANQVDIVVGVAETPVTIILDAAAFCSSAGANDAFVAIGEDSTTTPSSAARGGIFVSTLTSLNGNPVHAVLTKYQTAGRHFYAWLEKANASASGNVVTWVGVSTSGSVSSGMTGWIEG